MSEAIDEAQVRRLFMLLHGMYGNTVREFNASILKQAIAKCADKHKTFAPTLPEFRDICKSLTPRKWDAQGAVPRLEMSEALRSEQVERSRRAIAETRLRRDGGIRTDDGIKGLHVLIAKAVGHAGGDEAAMLLRLDSRMVGFRA
jgi:hypothetical protein